MRLRFGTPPPRVGLLADAAHIGAADAGVAPACQANHDAHPSLPCRPRFGPERAPDPPARGLANAGHTALADSDLRQGASLLVEVVAFLNQDLEATFL